MRARVRRLLAATVIGIGGWAAAQADGGVLTARAGDPQPWLRAADAAPVVGASLEEGEDLLALRTDATTLTVFLGSAEALLAGDGAGEVALSAPVRRDDDGWWLPLDALAPFGVRRAGDVLVAPDGRRWTLDVAPPPEATLGDARARLLRSAPGVRALELRDAVGADATKAVWIADLALVPLLRPELRPLIDDALREAGEARALLLVATARAGGTTFDGIEVSAGGARLVAPGARHDTLAGRADAVGPDAPWIAVVWLPPGTRLDLPLRIAWDGVVAEVVLRR
jgi:hypothetical protein